MNRLTRWWIKVGCDLRGETVDVYCMRRAIEGSLTLNICMVDQLTPALESVGKAINGLALVMEDAGRLPDLGMAHLI